MKTKKIKEIQSDECIFKTTCNVHKSIQQNKKQNIRDVLNKFKTLVEYFYELSYKNPQLKINHKLIKSYREELVNVHSV